MRIETFIRRALRLKAHRVVRVEENEAAKELVIHLDRREQRRLHCGECGRQAGRVAPMRRPVRRWRDLALREHIVALAYAPCRVWCLRCRWRVERVPWADKWQRVTHARGRFTLLSGAARSCAPYTDEPKILCLRMDSANMRTAFPNGRDVR